MSTDYPTPALDAAVWHTINSHPASRTAYEEADMDHGAWARVTVDGSEVVSPSRRTADVLQQYQSRVQRAIAEIVA
ncbi:hypothetical protein [Streptomyces lydicus]|uniref:hypothetical protein n=1 Tax=Streptomyces lydicus TaxID=47763 RepID=UPI0010132647|nr:hypothetical protein [Streptomyces lydicus]MCZ1012015.1 hypothetical protein [Streptomyces lydicus]